MSDRLVSQNGLFTLIQQNDGNLVTYGPNGFVVGYGKIYIPPPPPDSGSRPTSADVITIQGNFCNLKDSQGRVIFDPFIQSLPLNERADWLTTHRLNGSTHVVLAPSIHYPYYTTLTGIQGSNTLNDPMGFRELVLEVLDTPSATGRGFVPIIMLDEGESNPRTRIDTYWNPMIEGLRDLLPYCIICPGWELVRASKWTSADLSYGMTRLGKLAVPHMWVHLSPGRACGISNPPEPDDPWQGSERSFWTSHGGEYAEGFLFQSEAVQDGGVICDILAEDCWSNRYMDVVPRVGRGMNGWRIMPLCLFESAAYYFMRGKCSSATAREVATEARRLALAEGVTVSFGNGLPL